MTDTSPATRYQELATKLEELNRRRAVLEAQEKEKEQERRKLAKELKAEGVDLTDPEGEIERLKAEEEQHYEKAVGEVEAFEAELAKHTSTTDETEDTLDIN